MKEEFDKQIKTIEDIVNNKNSLLGDKEREQLLYLKGYMKDIFDHVLIDHLTGIYNKRKFDLDIKKEVQRTEQGNHDVSLVIYDIDDFKKIQDNHEQKHSYGDHILENVGKISKRLVKDFDSVYRIGGDEFTIILPNTQLNNGAVAAITRIKNKLNEDLGITISAGIANYKENANSVDELFRFADWAMYESKLNGKNKITIYGRGEV